jgi:hypothetical protein
MLAQIEFVGDVVKVAQILGLAGKALLPMPLVEQFAREREAVGVAFGIEAAAGIAVPVPGATEIGGRVEHGGVDAEIDQPLDLVNACHAGADDDHLVMGFGVCHRFLLRNLVCVRLARLQSFLPTQATARDRITAARKCRSPGDLRYALPERGRQLPARGRTSTQSGQGASNWTGQGMAKPASWRLFPGVVSARRR